MPKNVESFSCYSESLSLSFFLAVFYSSFALHLFVCLKIALVFGLGLFSWLQLTLEDYGKCLIWTWKEKKSSPSSASRAAGSGVQGRVGGLSTVGLNYGRDIRLRAGWPNRICFTCGRLACSSSPSLSLYPSLSQFTPSACHANGLCWALGLGNWVSIE